MNARLLIDAIVRQTTVLLAQIATSGGLRAPLSHIANDVFLDLAHELEAQGVSRKVSADMFGMALRAYIRKVQRLEESTTEHGRSLWNAVYEYLRVSGVVTRREVAEHFSGDGEVLVRSMLHDLTESGLVFAIGTGDATAYRAASDEELAKLNAAGGGRIDELLWALIFAQEPLAQDRIEGLGGLPSTEIAAALERLVARGVVTRSVKGAKTTYSSPKLLVPLGASAGWEAAVYDHVQAVVRTITQKLAGALRADATDTIGGSTYTFEVWAGHPLQHEVLGTLARFRREYDELRARVRAFNDVHASPAVSQRVVVYHGQSVTELSRGETEE